jgi:hypothetical protein
MGLRTSQAIIKNLRKGVQGCQGYQGYQKKCEFCFDILESWACFFGAFHGIFTGRELFLANLQVGA